MRRILPLCLALLMPLVATAAPASLTVTVEGLTPGAAIPAAQALCTPTTDGKSDKVASPFRPGIAWSDAPEGTASIAIFMMDPDVPADFTDAGKEGKTLPESMKRMDFYHYGLVGLAPTTRSIAGGSAATAPAQGVELVNDLGLNGYVTPATAYGGPCPPWNDARLHHYHFIVLALDKDAPVTAPTLRKGTPTADDPNTAKNTFDRLMTSPHVLAKGALIGTYTLNAAMHSTAK